MQSMMQSSQNTVDGAQSAIEEESTISDSMVEVDGQMYSVDEYLNQN